MSQEASDALEQARARAADPYRQTIELDCPPGDPRPGDLIESVIAGTGLEKREPVSKVFGNWEWDYSDVPHERWLELKPVLKARITNLYNSNVIRYGSW